MIDLKDLLIKCPNNSSMVQVNLICFPFAGGGTSNYIRWRPDLSPEIGLYALNLPGRERFFKEPFLTDYSKLIQELARIISTTMNKPCIFFGHSFGALTSYFITLELMRINATSPKHLFLSGRVPPTELFEPLGHLTLQDFKSRLIDKFQGIPQVILDSPDLLSLFLPIIQSDFKLYEQFSDVLASYVNKEVDCDITSIAYSEDSSNAESVAQWKNFTKKSHQHIVLPGGHFEILNTWKPIVQLINERADM